MSSRSDLVVAFSSTRHCFYDQHDPQRPGLDLTRLACAPRTQHVCSALAILQPGAVASCKKSSSARRPIQHDYTPLPGRRRSGSEHHRAGAVGAHLSFCPSTGPRSTVAWLCLGRENTCSAGNKADFPPSPPHPSRRGHALPAVPRWANREWMSRNCLSSICTQWLVTSRAFSVNFLVRTG